jgi:hypothetical protein
MLEALGHDRALGWIRLCVSKDDHAHAMRSERPVLVWVVVPTLFESIVTFIALDQLSCILQSYQGLHINSNTVQYT